MQVRKATERRLEAQNDKSMPIRSQAQFRLMQAAAHTPGGFGGVPQSVGQDFAAAGPVGGSFAKLPAKKKKPSSQMSKAFAEGRISKSAMNKRGYQME